LGEMQKAIVILDDPLIHIVGHGACTPAISIVKYFTLELWALLL
jgi:hypothetical protein